MLQKSSSGSAAFTLKIHEIKELISFNLSIIFNHLEHSGLQKEESSCSTQTLDFCFAVEMIFTDPAAM